MADTMAMANELAGKGYRYKTSSGHGVVRRLYKEYAVYGKARVHYKPLIGGTRSKSETFLLGYLYGWVGTRTTNTYNIVRLVGVSADDTPLFARAVEPLGGNRETLG